MKCPKCGKEISPQNRFCNFCGERNPFFNDQTNTQNSQQNAANSNNMNTNPQQPFGNNTNPQQPFGNNTNPQQPFGNNTNPQQPFGNNTNPQQPFGNNTNLKQPFGNNANPQAGSQKKSNTALIVAFVAVAAAAVIVLVLNFTGVLKRPFQKSGDTDIASEDINTAESEPSETANDSEGYDSFYEDAVAREDGTLEFVSSDVTSYPTVKLFTRFLDSDGNPIILTSPTAGIRESISGGDEIERKILSVEKLEGNQGVSFDIVADKSGSMEENLSSMQSVMTSFVNSLDYSSGDTAELISFDSFIMYMCTYTNDASLLDNGISNMTPYGETALYDALYAGVTNAGTREGARCVIGFTDGMDNVSMHTSEEVINLANQYEVPIYLIGFGGVDSYDFTTIAERTGGYYWDIDSINDMSDIFSEIYKNQKDMYCIEYESDGSADPYATRTVSAVLSDDANAGYFDNQEFTPVKAIEKQQHDSRYEVIKADISWTDANDEALRKGGHLITITSEEEENKAVELAEGAGISYCWIGGYTSERDGNIFGHWVTGENFSYSNWYPGEPSRFDEDSTPEFYLMLWNVGGEWSWNDQRNDVIATGLTYFPGKVGYIIEYED